MTKARMITKSLGLLYPHKSGLYAELQEALEKIFRITPEHPDWDPLLLHVQQALSFAVDVRVARGVTFISKKHYADPLTILKKFASLSDPRKPPLVDEETVLAAILYPAFHVRRSEGNFAEQYAIIHPQLKKIWSVFSDAAGNNKFTRNIRNLIIETLELSEINYRRKPTSDMSASGEEDSARITEEFHRFAHMVAERIELSGAKKEPRALKIRLAQRSVLLDGLMHNMSDEQAAAISLETSEVYVSLAASHKLLEIRQRLQRQLQLIANAKTFIAACVVVQNMRATAAALAERGGKDRNSKDKDKEIIVFEFLEKMLREIAPKEYTYRFEWRFKDGGSASEKITRKGKGSLHDIIGIRLIIETKFSGKPNGHRTRAECAACWDVHKALRAVTRYPHNSWGLHEHTKDFDNYIDGDKPDERKTRKRGYRALHYMFEIVGKSGSATVSFPFELQVTGEGLHAENMLNADHDRYKGIHKIELAEARHTTSVFVNNGRPVTLPRGSAHVMDYFVAEFGPEKALTVCNPRLRGVRDYGHLLDPKKQGTENQALRTIPRTGAEISCDFNPAFLNNQNRARNLVSACHLKRSRQQLERAFQKLHLQRGGNHTANGKSQAQAHHAPFHPAFEGSNIHQFPHIQIL